jgi:glycosyltransferase
MLQAIVEGTADLDAELALTSGGVDLTPIIGTPPERIRVLDFVPLSNLLPRCDALIHHSGMGTTYAALAAGVPQVALRANKGDAPLNTHVMSSRGAGIAVDRAEATPEAIGKALREVLQVPSYRTASEEVAAEMAAMPTPQDVVDQLAELTASRPADSTR